MFNKLIHRLSTKVDFRILGLLGVVYLLTRLINLTLLPIFTDESIYIYWAKFILENKSHWFISLTDGKPPLLVWMIGIFLTIFPQKWYLLAGRLPSVFAGLAGFLGIYFVTYELFKSKKAGYIASLLYIISPFMLFHDRMALYDSLLSANLIWAVYFALRTIDTRKIIDALFWGLFLGLGYFSKPPAIIFVFLTPLIPLFVLTKDKLSKNYKRYGLLILIAVVIAEVINNLQRLSSVYFLMDLKNQQFRQPLSELLNDPFKLTIGNLNGFFDWILSYYTLPFFILGMIALVFILIKNFRKGLLLLIFWFFPIFALATVGREIFPRYIVFTTPYFLILTAYFINYLLNQRSLIAPTVFALLIILFLQFKFDYFLLLNPVKAPFPKSDYNQYVGDHPSGYGIDKIFSFLDEELQFGHVTLVTQGTFGLYHYAFELEYWNDSRISIIPRWPLSSLDQEILDAQKSGKVYILFKEHDSIPNNLPLELVLKAEKPSGKYPLLLTRIK